MLEATGLAQKASSQFLSFGTHFGLRPENSCLFLAIIIVGTANFTFYNANGRYSPQNDLV